MTSTGTYMGGRYASGDVVLAAVCIGGGGGARGRCARWWSFLQERPGAC
ncbi:hypothetical protein [Methanoculleus chikugoensis]|nr:hypothetical protein [Methanoculleus chikugoensis]